MRKRGSLHRHPFHLFHRPLRNNRLPLPLHPPPGHLRHLRYLQKVPFGHDEQDDAAVVRQAGRDLGVPGLWRVCGRERWGKGGVGEESGVWCGEVRWRLRM